MLGKSSIGVFCLLVYSVAAIFPCSTAMPKSNQGPRLLRLSGKIVEGEITDDGSNNVKLALKLRLEIKNVGSKNALILKRDPVVVAREIIATPSDAAQGKYLYLLRTLPSIARNAEWEELQQRINKPTPPPDLICELAPNETSTLEITDWFYIGKKANIDPQSKSWDVIRRASPVSLQLTLQVWSGDIETYVDREKMSFSRKLQRRWQQVGELQLESLTSDPIPLDFAPFPVSTTKH